MLPHLPFLPRALLDLRVVAPIADLTRAHTHMEKDPFPDAVVLSVLYQALRCCGFRVASWIYKGADKYSTGKGSNRGHSSLKATAPM